MLHIPGHRPQLLIRELKPSSPAFPEAPAWHSTQSWDEQFYDGLPVADEFSIHTHEDWDGSMELVSRAAALIRTLGLTIPIMAKGFHGTDDQIEAAIESGAQRVLVCLGIDGREELPRANLLDKCRIEVPNLAALRSLSPDVEAVWNSRDLLTGKRKPETFDQARAAFAGRLCQASNLCTVADVHPEADMILIGRHAGEFSREVLQMDYVLF